MKGADLGLPEPADIESLLEIVYRRFHYDFRGYARASLQRRLALAQANLGCRSLAELTALLGEDPTAFSRVLQVLSVQVSDMFRDPDFYRTLRQHIVPFLRTYPSIKIWIAGCCGGEEIYSFAILLREEGLYDRATIYGTDINPEALHKAEAGAYPLERISAFTENHRLSGGKNPLSEYYSTENGVATFDPTLRKRVVFADHDLATDSVFAEVQAISCRNVLMYFDQELRNRVMGLFEGSLCRRGFLGIGSQESLPPWPGARAFHETSPGTRWYQQESK